MDLLFPEDLISNLGVPQIIDIRGQLPINPNYTWAQLAGVRPLEDLTTIGLHHDAWPKKNRSGVSDIDFAKEIAQDHIDLKANEKKGDAGFPYHIWIRNGKAYWCNNVLDRTYGIGGNNGYIVHICISGDYVRGDTLDDADRRVLLAAIITVAKQLPNYKEIKAHCELNPTDCPGYDYNSIKNDVQTLQMKMQQQDTWEAKLTKIAAMVNQFNYFNSLVKAGPDDGNSKWAVAQQMILYDVMKEKGYV